MIPLTFCYYSYPADYPKLELSVESVRRLYPDAEVLTWIPIGAPPPDLDIDVIPIEHDGPINGRAFCVDHIARLIELARGRRGGYLVKIDADVLANGTVWLANIERLKPRPGIYGHRGTLETYPDFHYAWGGAYAIQCDALPLSCDREWIELALRIAGEPYGGFRGIYAEDEVMSTLMRFLGQSALCKDHYDGLGMLGFWDFRNHMDDVTAAMWDAYAGYDFVEFGRLHQAKDPRDWLGENFSPEARQVLAINAMLRAAAIQSVPSPRSTDPGSARPAACRAAPSPPGAWPPSA